MSHALAVPGETFGPIKSVHRPVEVGVRLAQVGVVEIGERRAGMGVEDGPGEGNG
jgi:hypothetical protein